MDNYNIIISRMSIDDFDEIKDILTTEFDDFWSSKTLKEELLSTNSYYLVGKLNNEIIGFVGMKMVFNEADVMNVVTKKSLRNLGIASTLLTRLLQDAKELNISKLMLEVNVNNLSAIHLYEKFNFKKIAIREKYYNHTDDAVIMELSI